MNNMIHERPGVYSSYDASSVVRRERGGRRRSARRQLRQRERRTKWRLSPLRRGKSVFGEDTSGVYGMTFLLKFLFANGAGAGEGSGGKARKRARMRTMKAHLRH